MNAQDLFVDRCCQGQAVEDVHEELPKLDVVSALTFLRKNKALVQIGNELGKRPL